MINIQVYYHVLPFPDTLCIYIYYLYVYVNNNTELNNLFFFEQLGWGPLGSWCPMQTSLLCVL